jgi:hypothetical protein
MVKLWRGLALSVLTLTMVLAPSAAHGANDRTGDAAHQTAFMPAIRHIFLIVMENHDWASIAGSSSAPFINHTLLPHAAHAVHYYSPRLQGPSLPNYLWLEAGSNLGVTSDDPPSQVSQPTHQHLVELLDKRRVSWRAYEEGIQPEICPLTDHGRYAVRHDPFVYFRDITANNSPTARTCIAHVRPFAQLSGDLSKSQVPSYAFITPDLCHDMHDSCPPLSDSVAQGDRWLARVVPMIQHARPFRAGGLLLITWDEPEQSGQPIGLIALGTCAKDNGYAGTIHYTHSSTLRTVEELLRIRPLLRGAASATDLRDLFSCFPS